MWVGTFSVEPRIEAGMIRPFTGVHNEERLLSAFLISESASPYPE